MAILYGKTLTVGTLLCCILFVIYGLRLGGYLAIREVKSASYNKNMTGEIKTDVPFGVKIAIWVTCAVLYVLQVLPVFYRLHNGSGTNAWTWIGAAVMLFGIVFESAADIQKNAAKKVNPKRVEVSLRYTFDVEDIPSGDLAIALEAPNHFKLAVNGIPLSTSLDIGWWVDTSLRKIRIDPSLLHLGENTIDAVVDFTENFSGLEIIYLLGNFGSKIEGVDRVVVTDPPATLVAGNLCTQGLSFYSGNVGYATAITPEFNKGERVIVSCGSYNGAGVRVLVDGRPAGVVAWEPNEVDITDFVESGRQSEIVIELLGNRRNSHGSLHLNERWPRWHGPDSFEFGPENMGYNIVPLGFEKAPRLIVIK